MELNIIQLIRSDYYRYTGKRSSSFLGKLEIIFIALTARSHCFTYLFWLRLCAYKNFPGFIAKYMHYRLSRKYGIYIPWKTKIGYGFYIGHGVGIVINPQTIIGNNCNISQFLSIGSNNGTPAIIGDNVYIGPSVCTVENVHIGNNVSIGAGSVVTRDIPDNATVAGVPAKVLNYNNPGRFVGSRWKF